jgi:membrane protease YdiL (CAAX protease family)
MVRASLGWIRIIAIDSTWIGLATIVVGFLLAIVIVGPRPFEPHDGIIKLEDGTNIPFKTGAEHDSIIASHRGHIAGARYEMGYASRWLRSPLLMFPYFIVAAYVLIRDRSRIHSWFRLPWGWALAAVPLALAAQGTATLYGHFAERMGLDFKGLAIYRELFAHNDFRIVALLVAPVIEELYVRGRMYSVVEASAGSRTAFVVTSLLFALAHAWVAPASIPSYLLISCLLAWLRARTGGLVAPIAAHFAFNASALCWMAMQSQSRP